MSAIELTNPIQDSNDWKIQKALNIKSQLEKILFEHSCPLSLTNKARRQIKKLINEQVNLTDNMFQGLHADGSGIGTLDDDEKEIELLYQVLKKTPTLSFAKAEKTIKKWISEACSRSLTTHSPISLTFQSVKHRLIVAAYRKYMEEVNNKTVQVKTRGLNFVNKCFEYWTSQLFDPVIEEQINKTCDELKTFISTSFDDEYTFEKFSDSLILVLDISGSMNGIPLNTGLFYMLMMVKIFGIDRLYYFESKLEIRTISSGWTTNLELINQVYSVSKGSTNLDVVFQHLNNSRTSLMNVIIITDGDCDPGHYNRIGYSSNPFHEATREDKEKSIYPNIVDNNFVVVNVKQEKMNFPYLDLDPNVCYLTGNNPKTLNGFIKALCESTKTRTTITPHLILKYTLSMDELVFDTPIPTFSSVLTEERISLLFEAFKKNLPPKNIVTTEPVTEETEETEEIADAYGAYCADSADSANSVDSYCWDA
jgi:hypothetical protein